MRRSLLCCSLVLLLISFAVAQQKSSPKSKDAPPPAVPSFSARLPSEETVNSFMKQMFGYDSSVSWKIVAIRPTEAEGLTEVLMLLSNSQGQQNSRLYVTADGKHAVVGDIIPFGAHPFTPALETLSKGMNGPSRGPADAPIARKPSPPSRSFFQRRKTLAWCSRTFLCPATTGLPKAPITEIALDALRPTRSGNMWLPFTTRKKT
jgi:hypothetical protein